MSVRVAEDRIPVGSKEDRVRKRGWTEFVGRYRKSSRNVETPSDSQSRVAVSTFRPRGKGSRDVVIEAK